MAEANEIYFDEKTGQVVELVQQPVNPDSFQAELDAAQNAVNTATEVAQTAANALAAAQEAVNSADKNLEAAKEVLAFQEGRKAAYDKAVASSQNAAEASPVTDAEDLAGIAAGESVDVPITLATE